MHDRTKMISAVATLAVALAAGSGVALASGTGAKPDTHAKTISAPRKAGNSKSAPGSKSAQEQQGHDAIVASVAAQLHLSTATVSAALSPIFAAGYADSSSPTFATAAHALGVMTQQLADALTHAKESLAGSQSPSGAKGKVAPGSKSAQEQQGHDAIVASVAAQLHLSTATVSAALSPFFAAGQADPSSATFATAAHTLGVTTAQLANALMHGKQSVANGS